MSVLGTTYAEVLNVTDDMEAGTANVTRKFGFNSSISVGNNFKSSRGNTTITSDKEVTIGGLSLLPSKITTSAGGQIVSDFNVTQVVSAQTNFTGTLSPDTAWTSAFASGYASATDV